jgi:hypothetical protein
VAANPCNDHDAGGGHLTSNDELVLIVPASDTAQVFNVTVTNTTATSYLTVFGDPTPDQFTPPPLAADLVWTPGQFVSNLVIVAPAGTPAAIAFYNLAGHADLVIDRQGAYRPLPAPDGTTANTNLTPAARRHPAPAHAAQRP